MISTYECEDCGIGVEYNTEDLTEYNENDMCETCFDRTFDLDYDEWWWENYACENGCCRCCGCSCADYDEDETEATE